MKINRNFWLSYAVFSLQWHLFENFFILIARTAPVKSGLLQWRRADERDGPLGQQHNNGGSTRATLKDHQVDTQL